jgi:hypothetical protein
VALTKASTLADGVGVDDPVSSCLFGAVQGFVRFVEEEFVVLVSPWYR